MNILQTRDIKAEDFFNLQSPKERIAFLLQYGVFAPSTHNSQPWNFKIGDDFCEIIRNDDHPIRHADPKERDLHISFGCLIENIVIAAKYFKVFKDVEYILESSRVVRIVFSYIERVGPDVDTTIEPLLRAILYRVNARGIFDNETVDQNATVALSNISHANDLHLSVLDKKEEIAQIANLTRQGLLMAYADLAFRKEMSQWFNSSLSSKPTGIPGYSLRMPLGMSLIFSSLVRHVNIGKKLGHLNYISICSAPMALVITADQDSKQTWIETGRYAERMMLQANALGYKTSIFTAAIEMGDLYKDVQTLVNTTAIPQFILLVGKLSYQQKPNLRYSVESKIIA